MKLVTYVRDSQVRLGAIKNDMVFDLSSAASTMARVLPSTMQDFLYQGESALDTAREVLARSSQDAPYATKQSAVQLIAPVPRPPSMRDGYAFRQHVETARRNRGLGMIEEFDQFPVFYFTNHNAVFGPGKVPVRSLHLEQLDFELECAIVIGKGGRDIPADRADEHIAGYTIMNDLSARSLQMQEMKMNLGPAKGKDFATVLGPYLVTPDELVDRRVPGPKGDRHDLAMEAWVNGTQVSKDSLRNMNFTFAQIIERASYGVDLYPGDVIGSGTCGTGCFLELNGSKITNNQWLKPGDRVELRIERLGALTTEFTLTD